MNTITLPPVFDLEFYIKEAKLNNITYNEAIEHFYTKGKQEGLRGNIYASREHFVAFLRKNFLGKNILEIGPAAKPSMIGNHVRYFDIMNADECKKWAIKNNENLENCPKFIDYVSEQGDLSVIKEKFGLIFSSHNIEHLVDLILFMHNIYKIIDENGFFACVVPDKRYTFDYYRNQSSIIDIICQHIENPSATVHPMNTIISHMTQSTHNDPSRHWKGDHGEININLEKIKNSVNWYKQQSGYLSAHRWCFTDDSFKCIFDNLYKMSYIPMKIIRCYNTPKNSNSFCAIFQKKA